MGNTAPPTIMFRFLLLASALSVAPSWGYVDVGKCPTNLTAPSSFNVTSYLGRWYENRKYPNVFQPKAVCTFAEYGPLNATWITVANHGIKSDGKDDDIKGFATTTDQPGALKVVFFGVEPSTPNYLVLDTDYHDYSCVYYCSEKLGVRMQDAWILTREKVVAQATVDKALDIFKKNGISLDHFTVTDQSGCPSS